MDLLSELFRDVQLASTIYGRFDTRAPWAVGYPAGPLTGFHVVLEGECWRHAGASAAPTHLVAGDFVVLPDGTARVLGDSASPSRFPPPSVAEVVRCHGTEGISTSASVNVHAVASMSAVPQAARFGGTGARMQYLAGAFEFGGDGAAGRTT